MNKSMVWLGWLLTASIFSVLLLPKMIQEGLFMDGMLYSCVSHNLAQGYGTFWFPKFNEAGIGGLATFHEHPPLVFGIQALFFKVLGDSYYVEKVYSLFTALVTAWLMVLIWNLLFKREPRYQKLSWIPVLLWIIMPIIYFSYQNNLMENSMSIFSLLSVFFALKILVEGRHLALYLFLSGFAVFLATFSKGLPGLFTISVFGLWWIINRSISFKQVFIYTLVITAIPVLIYVLLIVFNEHASESLSNYFFKRAMHRIQNVHTVGNRFHVLGKLLAETGPSLILVSLILLISRFKGLLNKELRPEMKNALFITSVGLAGTLPLMLTLVQKSFYFIHALPFIGLGLGMLIAPPVFGWLAKFNPKGMAFKITMVINILLFLGVMVYTGKQVGKTERDHDLLFDVHKLGETIPPWSVVKIDKSMHENYTMHCYMVRYYNITLDWTALDTRYMLLEKNMDPNIGNDFEKLQLPLKVYSLYSR